MAVADRDKASSEEFNSRWIELIIRLSVLALLIYLSFVLIRPFLTIAIWSVILAVALYPLYDRIVRVLGGRRRLAAVLLTLICLLVVIGPASWLLIGLIDGVRTLSERIDFAALVLPQPREWVKQWPLIGDQLYQLWDFAANNVREALTNVAPYLRPVGAGLLGIATEAGMGVLMFFIAIIVAGFLYSPAPILADAIQGLARRLDADRGPEFTALAAATIRTVSRGVIGISALQAFFAGVGFMAAGIPGASLLTSAVLVLGIIQIGPSILIIPLIIWSWMAMETTAAVLFTAYMIPVNLMDNVLRPLVMGRGLNTPMLVILIGVIGGAISYGITGLFLGPIILAVIWELLMAWIRETRSARALDDQPQRSDAV
jgi:predicted PurR-regulated permease PerM